MEKPEIKKFIIKRILEWLIFVIFFGVFSVIAKEYKLAIQMFFACTVLFSAYIAIVLVGNKVIFLMKKNVKNKMFKQYTRNIPKEYSVAVASLIYDNVFERTIDIPATILSLIGKTILVYKKEEKKEIIVNQNVDISELDSHEKYIYESIKNKKKIISEVFQNYIINDAVKKGFVKRRDLKGINQNLPLKSILAILILCVLITILDSIVLIRLHDVFRLPILVGTLLCAFFSPIIIKKKYELDSKNFYKNTKLGDKEALRLAGLKNYIEDFSLLSKKEIEESILWEDYLAYAYMFKINKKILQYFEELEGYENLFEFNIFEED